jgi:hypothetical protein
MIKMKTNKIEVCKRKDRFYFLRITFASERLGAVTFETREEFTKPEADCRAMELSSIHGWDRDELPTVEEG